MEWGRELVAKSETFFSIYYLEAYSSFTFLFFQCHLDDDSIGYSQCHLDEYELSQPVLGEI